ncbi:MAG: type II toxin-antitoxin system RelE/ParE family toxin [Micrococcales bacterium]|nr:type II toxin-antitoxin system RelE/ParE family toxin [Micrococcales bacterium]MCL2667723.1 type II toxin-antitoxin system RelE/ParE family toxin [Micrococcales bacterium]
MSYSVVFAATARRQLADICTYIADAADPGTASAFVKRIVEHCLGLETFPHRGSCRDDLRPGLRTIGFRRRVVIAFEVDDDTQRVTVHGIFYGGQDLDAAFVDEPGT